MLPPSLTQCHEPRQHAQSVPAAFLRVVLHAQHIAMADIAGDLHLAVDRIGNQILRQKLLGIKRMHIIDERLFFCTDDRIGLCVFQAIPSDVRDLDVRILHADDLSLQQSQPFALFDLIAFLKEHLHAQTDAQQRFSRMGLFFDRFDETGLFQIAHAIAKGADPREDQTVRCGQRRWVLTDLISGLDRIQGVADAVQVAHAIIDDRDHSSTPFVLGSVSSTMRIASRRARPNALKTASTL